MHRPLRTSGGDPEGVENDQGAEDVVELAKLDRKSPLARRRPRVPARTRLTHLQWRARGWERPPKATRARARSFGDDVDFAEIAAQVQNPPSYIMLRRLKKFTVYSSVIVAGQASRALDNAPFAGQDESEDAKGLLRRLSDCEDDQVLIAWKCIDSDETNV